MSELIEILKDAESTMRYYIQQINSGKLLPETITYLNDAAGKQWLDETKGLRLKSCFCWRVIYVSCYPGGVFSKKQHRILALQEIVESAIEKYHKEKQHE